MTETSPLCVIGRLRTKHAELPAEEQLKLKLKQGHGIWGVDLKIVDDDGRPLPWDGKAFGEVFVRGPWIASGYFKGEGGDKLDAEGYFPTGDVATIDPDGYVHLVDRSKDVIKSGGEWISSIRPGERGDRPSRGGRGRRYRCAASQVAGAPAAARRNAFRAHGDPRGVDRLPVR